MAESSFFKGRDIGHSGLKKHLKNGILQGLASGARKKRVFRRQYSVFCALQLLAKDDFAIFLVFSGNFDA
jgi:hypothetical protein